MKSKRFLKIALTVVLFLNLMPSVSPVVKPTVVLAGSDDNFMSNQIQISENDIISENSAYILFKETDVMHGMSYLQAGNANEKQHNYNKLVNFQGMQGRQYLKDNIMSIKFDKDFATEEDSMFIVNIDYYDYGGAGSFGVEYMPQNTDTTLRLTVAKNGDGSGGTLEFPDGKWWRVSMLINDANFTQKLEGGYDIRIYTSAWNAFSKIEVVNVSRYGATTADIGTFNMAAAEALNKLGVFDGYGDDEKFDPQLSKVLTREEALELMMTCYGLKDEAKRLNLKPTTDKVSAEKACYAGLAEEKGIIEASADIDLTQTFTQRELLVWYLKLIGIEDSDLWGNAYQLVRDLELVTDENMIIQPERTANIDALVVLAANTFAETNRKTGYNAFTKGFEEGKYKYETIIGLGYAGLNKWMRKNPFKLPSHKMVDPLTGRTYHMVDFFGSTAYKTYFTQNCVAMDNKRVYFSAADYGIYEYNIETEMCRWIAQGDHLGNIDITPLNNLWYVVNNQIRKVDLDTYEDTFVHEGFKDYKTYYQTLQVNNDETMLSIEVGSDDWVPESARPSVKPGRYINFLDLTKGEDAEWDFSHVVYSDYDKAFINHFGLNPNPKYKNWAFFAHDDFLINAYTGQNTQMHQRNWMLNLDTDEYFNVYDQRWYIQPYKDNVETGRISTGSNHESWSRNGEWFTTACIANHVAGVPIPLSVRAIQALMRPDGSDLWLVPADYSKTKNYYFQTACICHSSVDWNANWIIGDTTYNSTNKCDFNITETHTGKNVLLARFEHNGLNNGHVHPQFSPDASIVVFGGWSPGFKTVQWGWMDVSDITGNPTEGGRYDISESCESFSYKGDFDHSTEPKFNKDGSLKEVRIPAGRSMYVDVKKTVVEKDNTPAEITITYKDDSKMPLKLCYYTWKVNSPGDINEFTEREIYIERKGTNAKVTKTIKLDDICLGNMELLRSDFRIRAAGGSATVYSVEVSVPQTD